MKMDLTNNENSRLSIEGHIKIIDPDTGEVILSKRNAINFENMSVTIANLLANNAGTSGSYVISNIRFGNGGTIIDSDGNITYKTTNTDITSGALYNQTYKQTVDDTVTQSSDNQVVVSHTSNTDYSDVTITCLVAAGYPTGEDTTDLGNSADYIFDEVAVYNANGEMLTHVIFVPRTKESVQQIQITYTIRIKTTLGT
tara:strand:- start:1557 stop:2153 length:597 start_codon:yes stop_codon:yes gene_type:complete